MEQIGINKILINPERGVSISKDTIRRFRGIAASQLNILESFMGYQRLKQCSRRIRLDGGVVIDCSISFGRRTAVVHIPSSGGVEPKTVLIRMVTKRLIIAYGNPEDYVDIVYTKDSPLFIPESVTCTDGDGTVDAVEGTRLFGTFNTCWDAMIHGNDSFASASVSNSIESHYERKYKYKELFKDSLFLSEPKDDLSISGPMDQPPVSDVPDHGPPASTEMWTKTLDDLVVTAFIFYPSGTHTAANKRWAVFAQFKGVKLSWGGSGSYYPAAGFARCRMLNYDYIDTFIGFDLWTEVNSETEKTEYFIGLISDQEANYTVWKVNPEIGQAELVFQKQALNKGGTDGESDKYWRLVGYRVKGNAHTAYWAQVAWAGGYTEEDLREGSQGTHSTTGTIDAAMWNPVTRELILAVDDDSINTSEFTDGPYSRPDEYYTYGYFQYFAAELCGSSKWLPPDYDTTIDLYGCQCISSRPDNWPCGFDVWSQCWTEYWMSEHTFTSYGSFWIGFNSLGKGSTHREKHSRATKETQMYHGGCSVGHPHGSSTKLDSRNICEPFDRKDYSFTGWIFAPWKWSPIRDNLAYRYSELEYYEEDNFCNSHWNENGITACVPKCAELKGDCPSGCYCYSVWSSWEECQCAELAWNEKEGGLEELRPFIDTVFPYDHTWTAILLHGTGRTSEDDETEAEYSDLVIYKTGATLYSYDGLNVTQLDETENPVRAFFLQHEEITEYEEEVV